MTKKLRGPGLIKLLKCHSMAANFESLFRDYVRTHRVKELALANGLTIKKYHTIVGTYPLRVTDSSKRELDWLCAAVLMGGERYLEFERVKEGATVDGEWTTGVAGKVDNDF
jgi:hypothetical protein